jgi:hypothetical protein
MVRLFSGCCPNIFFRTLRWTARASTSDEHAILSISESPSETSARHARLRKTFRQWLVAIVQIRLDGYTALRVCRFSSTFTNTSCAASAALSASPSMDRQRLSAIGQYFLKSSSASALRMPDVAVAFISVKHLENGKVLQKNKVKVKIKVKKYKKYKK